MKLWVVDAFTDCAFTGNPAAVALVDTFPSDARCLQIAAEMNLSETAFVRPVDTHHVHIRWFTPTTEVALCGHATLASAHLLRQEKGWHQGTLRCDSLSGPLYVSYTKPHYIMDFPLQAVRTSCDLSQLEGLFDGIKDAVYAGEDLLIVLEDPHYLRRLQPDIAAIALLHTRGVIVTARAEAGSPYDFISRFFAPNVGVNEDPVCGSAHCALADYWQHQLSKTTLLAYQASSRGGVVGIEVQGTRVLLKGQAITTLQATLCV
jgi:PhzF family phenazine biosynthesis protein